jgi:secondary thiamine-phosphate synthase enzyme
LPTYTKEIRIDSCEKTHIVDVTERVADIVSESGISDGTVTLFTTHTTTAIRINENESGLLDDIKVWLETKAPPFRPYRHDRIDERPVPEDEPVNAHSHLKSLLMGASESVPVICGKMPLGTWQSIFFMDFDGPRKRKMLVHVVGDKR